MDHSDYPDSYRAGASQSDTNADSRRPNAEAAEDARLDGEIRRTGGLRVRGRSEDGTGAWLQSDEWCHLGGQV